MNLACEAELRVENEKALRFAASSAPVIEYIKSISSLVGASHILAVFEEHDTIKVFFDDIQFVDTLVATGIHVLGRHIKADYVVPPGTKITLLNIDPVVSNFDLTRLLSLYGTVVSPVFHPPISDDSELCHIRYGVRFVYMELHGTIPNKLEFKYGDQFCTVKVVKTIDNFPSVPYIKADDNFEPENSEPIEDVNNCNIVPSISNDSFTFDNVGPVVVSVESGVSTLTTTNEQATSEPYIKESKPARRRGRLPKALQKQKTPITPTSRAAKKIKLTFKLRQQKQMKMKKKGKRGRKPKQKIETPSPPSLSVLRSLSPSSSDIETSSTPPPSLTDGNAASKSPNSILDEYKLKMFLEEVKHQRSPIECVKKYLGTDSKSAVDCLVAQLDEYSKDRKDISLKLRIQRLIKCLEQAT